MIKMMTWKIFSSKTTLGEFFLRRISAYRRYFHSLANLSCFMHRHEGKLLERPKERSLNLRPSILDRNARAILLQGAISLHCPTSRSVVDGGQFQRNTICSLVLYERRTGGQSKRNCTLKVRVYGLLYYYIFSLWY